MKTAKTLQAFCLLTCCLFGQFAFGQNPAAVQVTNPEVGEASVDLNVGQTFLIEVTGPNGYYHRQETAKASEYRISPIQADGTPFADGSYQMQITPVYSLTEEQQAELVILRENNDEAGIAAYRAAHNLPAEANVYVVNYGINAGKFVAASTQEAGSVKLSNNPAAYEVPELTSSLVSFAYYEGSYEPLAMDRTLISEDDQVILDDLIVDGSVCIGLDCVNGENFGFDTQRLKENNLRIHFDDTSTSASFPKNDWRITINDSNNGGASYFAIDDATAGTRPMTIRAGAGNNALYVGNNGNVGLGTASPVLELQLTDGDTPSMRLEQNGTFGWAPQTWDIAGNEANFFIRDVTNGSLLPFRIRPRAPQNSIYVDAEGDIGLGTDKPGDNGLQVENGSVYIKKGNLGINTEPSGSSALQVEGGMSVTGTTLLTGDYTQFMTTGASFFSPAFGTVLRLDAVNERVGIGTATPMHQLEVSTDDVVKPTAGGWLGASDRRLKKDIADFNDGLDVLMNIRPVTYSYNGKLGLPTEQEHIGIIAQEIQPLAPYTIKPLKIGGPDNDEDYLAFDGSPLTYVLINSVQEQQKIIDAQQKEIDALKAQVAEISELKAQMASISKLLATQKTTAASVNQSLETKDE